MSFETPQLEYSQLMPMLIVFGAAIVGVLVEAFMGRRYRFEVQLGIALSALVLAFASVVVIAGDLGVTAMGAIAIDGPTLFLQGTILLLGFYPKPLLDVINPAVEHTMTQVGTQDPEPTVTEGEAHE